MSWQLGSASPPSSPEQRCHRGVWPKAKLVPGGLGNPLVRCEGEKPVLMFGKRCFLVGRSKSWRNEQQNSLPRLRAVPWRSF